jgi:hypothetical protein
MEKIDIKTKIPQTTLYRWYRTWKECPKWCPWRAEESYRHLCVFTTEEKIAIREFIIANFVISDILFTNEDFPRITMQAFFIKHQYSEDPPEFNCSNGFIKNIESRKKFSSRRAHYKWRPKKDSIIEDAWMEEMRDLMHSTSNPDRLVNRDETCWRMYPDGLRTWAPSESDHVTISIAGNEK